MERTNHQQEEGCCNAVPHLSTLDSCALVWFATLPLHHVFLILHICLVVCSLVLDLHKNVPHPFFVQLSGGRCGSWWG